MRLHNFNGGLLSVFHVLFGMKGGGGGMQTGITSSNSRISVTWSAVPVAPSADLVKSSIQWGSSPKGVNDL